LNKSVFIHFKKRKSIRRNQFKKVNANPVLDIYFDGVLFYVDSPWINLFEVIKKSFFYN